MITKPTTKCKKGHGEIYQDNTCCVKCLYDGE